MEHHAHTILVGGVYVLLKELKQLPFELLEYCWKQTDHLYVKLAFDGIQPDNTFEAQQLLIRLYGHFAAIQRQAKSWSKNMTILLPNSRDLALIAELTHIFSFNTARAEEFNKKRLDRQISLTTPHIIAESLLQKLSISLAEANIPEDRSLYTSKFKSFDCASLAGTFDRLHYDHKILLTLGTLITKTKLVTAVLTVTGGKKHQELIEAIEARAANVKKFIEVIDTTIPVKEFQIVSRCQVADGCRLMNDAEIEAAVVENNEEGVGGISRVNALRASKYNLIPLTVVWKHSCRIVSSTDIREWIVSNNNVSEKEDNKSSDNNKSSDVVCTNK